MGTLSVLKPAGLYTADNPLSGVPEGAMVTATNAVMRYRGVVEPRRGQGYYQADFTTDTTFGSGSQRSREGYFYGGALLHLYAASPAGPLTLGRFEDGVGHTDYSGTYTPPSASRLRIKFMEAASNLYFTTSVGPYFLDSVSGTPALAGVPAALDSRINYGAFSWLPVDYHANGWMAPDTAVAYAFVWGTKDANGNVKLGAPSRRLIIRNRIRVESGNVVRAANVVTVSVLSLGTTGDIVELINEDATFGAGPHTLTGGSSISFTYAEAAANASSAQAYFYGFRNGIVTIPQVPTPNGVTTSHFLRVYRTESVSDGDADPGEEFYLVKEVAPTSTDITNGYLAFTDYTPDSQLDVALYTNPNDGEGTEAAKFRPPVAWDMCWWDGRAWYFNTTDKHRFYLRLLGVGTPDGVQNNDTLNVAGTTLTAKTGSASGNQFLITTAYPSASQNIEATARDLVKVINVNQATYGVVAYYVSGEGDAPGNVLIEERGIGGGAIAVYASRPASWGPALTTGSSGAQESSADRRAHGASYSDVGEPEAVRLTSYLEIATKGVNILRAIPFRERLYVFADNRKIYKVSGPFPYTVDEVDGTAQLISPDSVQVHANQVFAFTDQGLGTLSDAGFRILSGPYDDEIQALISAVSSTTMRRITFGVSYEADRQYQLWLPTDGNSYAQVAYVYNSLNNTWTKWTGNRTWGRVNPTDGKLYLGEAEARVVRQERKGGLYSDYADAEFAVTTNSVSGAEVTLSSASGVAVGDVYHSGSSGDAILITAVNGNVLTLVSALAGTGTHYIRKAYAVTLKFHPLTAGAPALVKSWRDVTFHFKRFYAYGMQATFDSETYVTEGTAALKPFAGYADGQAHGAAPASNADGMRNRRVEVPSNHHQAALLRVGLTITEAHARWALHGLTVNFNPAGEGGRP